MNAGDLTVVVPAYNAERTLSQALVSALAVPSVSLVAVIDDGSTDGTADLARAFAMTDARVRLETQPNTGTAAARHRGALIATTPFVLFLDADDCLLAEGTESLLRAIRAEDATVGVVGGLARYLRSSKGNLGGRTRQDFRPVTLETLLLKRFTPWPPGAAICRLDAARSALDGCLAESVSRTYPEDYVFLVELVLRGFRAVLVDVDALGVGVSSDSKTYGLGSQTLAAADRYAKRIWREHGVSRLELPPIPPARTIELRRSMISASLAGNRLGAAKLGVRLAASDPAAIYRGLRRRLMNASAKRASKPGGE